MPGVSIAMQEKNRDRLDSFLFQSLRQSGDLVVVERLQNFTAGKDPLMHLVTMTPRHQWLVLREKEVVGIRPVDAADLVDVAEARGDEKRGLSPRAFENRVDCDRRAVEENRRLGEVCAGLRDAGFYALNQSRRRRQRFPQHQPPAARIEGGDVREGAADIRGKSEILTLVHVSNVSTRQPITRGNYV